MAHDGRVLVKVNAKWQQHSTEHKEDWEGAKVHRTQPCLQLQLYALQCTFAVPAATTTATALAAFSHKHIYANVHKYSIISMSQSPPLPISLCHWLSQLDVTASSLTRLRSQLQFYYI